MRSGTKGLAQPATSNSVAQLVPLLAMARNAVFGIRHQGCIPTFRSEGKHSMPHAHDTGMEELYPKHKEEAFLLKESTSRTARCSITLVRSLRQRSEGNWSEKSKSKRQQQNATGKGKRQTKGPAASANWFLNQANFRASYPCVLSAGKSIIRMAMQSSLG